MSWSDKWSRRPALVETVAKIVSTVAPRKKPAPPRERTGGYWPDDDLAELEHPEKAHQWIPHDRVKDWLRRR